MKAFFAGRYQIGFFIVTAYILSTGIALAGVLPGPACQSIKEKVAGKYAKCIATAASKQLKKDDLDTLNGRWSKCAGTLHKGFEKADIKYGANCPAGSDNAMVINLKLHTCLINNVIETSILGGATIDPATNDPANAKCDSGIAKVAGKYLDCLMKTQAKATKQGLEIDTTTFAKCAEKGMRGIEKVNIKRGTCSKADDTTTILSLLDGCKDELIFATPSP